MAGFPKVAQQPKLAELVPLCDSSTIIFHVRKGPGCAQAKPDAGQLQQQPAANSNTPDKYFLGGVQLFNYVLLDVVCTRTVRSIACCGKAAERCNGGPDPGVWLQKPEDEIE